MESPRKYICPATDRTITSNSAKYCRKIQGYECSVFNETCIAFEGLEQLSQDPQKTPEEKPEENPQK